MSRKKVITLEPLIIGNLAIKKLSRGNNITDRVSGKVCAFSKDEELVSYVTGMVTEALTAHLKEQGEGKESLFYFQIAIPAEPKSKDKKKPDEDKTETA